MRAHREDDRGEDEFCALCRSFGSSAYVGWLLLLASCERVCFGGIDNTNNNNANSRNDNERALEPPKLMDLLLLFIMLMRSNFYFYSRCSKL